MNIRVSFTALLLLAVPMVLVAKKPTRKHRPDAKFVTTYTVGSASAKGQGGADQAAFVVVWEGATYPQAFFWRGDNGWLNCSMQKAHKHGKEYTSESLTADKISKGDTLMLTPVAGGRFAIPAEIPKTSRNTLYYKMGDSKWLPLPVKNKTK
jgi:hypothetical protein